MLNARPWLSLVVAGALSAAAAHASAAGFGASASPATLGQPLAFSVAFRVDAGDPLTADCIDTEVTLGDRRVPSSDVRTTVEMQGTELARIRVRTTRPVDEPVVGVVLNAGCNARQTRRFVLFADPPAATVATVATAATALPMVGRDVTASSAPTPAAAPSTASALAPSAVRASGSDASPPSLQPSPPSTRSTRPRTTAARRPASDPADAAARSRQRAASAERRRESARRSEAAAAAAALPVAAEVEARPTNPRLKLDFADPSPPDLVDAALAAVAEAASATRAANDAASAAAARITALERDVERLRAEARASQKAASGWQSRLADAEASSRWLWPLILLTLVLAALASWLSWRLSVSQRQRQVPWQDVAAQMKSDEAAAGALSAPMPFVIGAAHSGSRARGTPAWPPAAALDTLPPDEVERDTVSLHNPKPPLFAPALAAGMHLDIADGAAPPAVDGWAGHASGVGSAPAAEAAMERTQPYVPPWSSDDSAPRDVSIEELIDLEQQAEFFVVLGQDEAAVDLLVDHLRQTGGGSPLPYLKLLEIYHRREDREEYERTRSRFNQRFNAFAPDWDVGLNSGRSLDDYAGVVPRLQQVWSRPLDAMAELEALLFRKSRGELFDLPAYREVLFLYGLARDLLDREAADTGTVDLLLPISDGSSFGNTEPAPYLELVRTDGDSDDDINFDDVATLPVDLDLSNEQTRPASIFDALHDTLKRPPPPERR